MSGRHPHSACRPGKRVRVVLKDGTTFVAKFLDKKPNQRMFFEGIDRPIRSGDLKSFTIVKGAK